MTAGVWLFALQTMFGQFDVNGSGSISAAQCKSGAQQPAQYDGGIAEHVF